MLSRISLRRLSSSAVQTVKKIYNTDILLKSSKLDSAAIAECAKQLRDSSKNQFMRFVSISSTEQNSFLQVDGTNKEVADLVAFTDKAFGTTSDKALITFVSSPAKSLGAVFGLYGTFVVADEFASFSFDFAKNGVIPDALVLKQLAGLKYNAGKYLLLTGETINAYDARDITLVTHFIPRYNHSSLLSRLDTLDPFSLSPSSLLWILREFETTDSLPSQWGGVKLPHLMKLFAGNKVKDIKAALSADNSPFAQKTLAQISTVREEVADNLLAALQLAARS